MRQKFVRQMIVSKRCKKMIVQGKMSYAKISYVRPSLAKDRTDMIVGTRCRIPKDRMSEAPNLEAPR